MFLHFFGLYQACRKGYFGGDCTETCGHCRDEDQCSIINGTCLTGCAAGYQGIFCKYSKYYSLKEQDFIFLHLQN